MESDVLLTCIISSSLAATIVTTIKELIVWKWNRKANKEDKVEEKNDITDELTKKIEAQDESITRILSILEELEEKFEISQKCDRLMVQDRIKFLVLDHLRSKEISLEDRKLIHDMWDSYHYGLGGNGDLDSIMKILDSIPIKTD